MALSKKLLFLFLSFGLYLSAQMPDPNLILHLTFDGNSLSDSSVFGHNVINHGTSFTTGINNSGVLLTGTNQYVEVSHSSNLEISNNLTISLWYKHKVQGSSTSFYSLVEQSANEDGGHSRYGMWLFGSQLWMCIEPDSCPGGASLCQRCISEGITLVEDEWYYIAGTYDGRTLKMYLDGQLIKEENFGSSTGISVRSYPLTIGTDVYDPSPVYLEGTLDEIQLYDIALTSAQITQLNNEFNTASVDDKSFKVAVYPNPAKSIVNIKSLLQFDSVEFFDLNGQLLKTTVLENDMVDIKFLSSGVYVMRFLNDTSSYFQRLVVK